MINVGFGLADTMGKLDRSFASLRQDKSLKRPETALAAYDIKAVGEPQPSFARLGRAKASAPDARPIVLPP